MERNISDIFGYGNDVLFWEDCGEFDPEEIKALTFRRLHPHDKGQGRHLKKRRISRTLLVAAVIASLFTVSALAAGLSIHSRQQEQLRQAFQVEENHVNSYEEFPLPSAADTDAPDTPSITLLSAIKNGESEDVYVSISPVTKEDIHVSVGRERFSWSVDGGRSFGMALPVYDTSKITEADYTFSTDPDTGLRYRHISYEALERVLLESYDEETKSLMVKVSLLCDSFEYDVKQPLELMIQCRDINYADPVALADGGHGYECTLLLDYGTIILPPISAECLSVRFPEPVKFENEETGGLGLVTGVELYANSASWIIEHDGMENIYSCNGNPPELSGDELTSLQISWSDAIDQVLSSASVQYADGSSIDIPGGVVAVSYDGKEMKCPCDWKSTIDISQVSSISIAGVSISVR